MKLIYVFFAAAVLAVSAKASPPTFADQLVAQRVRLGFALLQSGTVLNVAVGPADFYPWARFSPFQKNFVAPSTVQVVNIVVDSGLAPIRRAADMPISIGVVSAINRPIDTPAIGTVAVTNPAALRQVNTRVTTAGLP